jgi:hypothetical protein
VCDEDIEIKVAIVGIFGNCNEMKALTLSRRDCGIGFGNIEFFGYWEARFSS